MPASADSDSRLIPLAEFARQVDLPSVKSPLFPRWYDARKKLSDLLWEQHSANAFQHYRTSKPAANPPSIEKTGLYDEGRLGPEEAGILLGLFRECPVIPFSADDFQPGYNFDPTGSMEHINTYRKMTPAFEAKLGEVLARIAPAVEEICGHHFRIVSSHIWSLNPGPHKYQWHLDGWPVALKKLFIFPSGVDERRGSTAFRLKTGGERIVSGPPGTWMIFENSALEHKGFESLTDARPTIAISFAPSFRTDLRLFDAGVNSGFPWFPIESANGAAGPGYYAPGSVNQRMLKAVAEGAGLAPLLAPGDMLPAAALTRELAPPAAATPTPPRPTLRQRLRPRTRLKAMFKRLRSQ